MKVTTPDFIRMIFARQIVIVADLFGNKLFRLGRIVLIPESAFADMNIEKWYRTDNLTTDHMSGLNGAGARWNSNKPIPAWTHDSRVEFYDHVDDYAVFIVSDV